MCLPYEFLDEEEDGPQFVPEPKPERAPEARNAIFYAYDPGSDDLIVMPPPTWPTRESAREVKRKEKGTHYRIAKYVFAGYVR